VCPSRVSFKDFCVVAKVMIIQKNSLAKFGNILNMIVDRQKKKKKKSFYILGYLPTGTYHKNLEIWKFFSFSLNFGEFESNFSMKNH